MRALTGCRRRKPKRQATNERALAEKSVEAEAVVTAEAAGNGGGNGCSECDGNGGNDGGCRGNDESQR
jgi:hypothetical protein